MNEKDKLFKSLDGVIAGLKEELGHEPDDVDIVSRLALMFGVFAAGFAEKHSDPHACLERTLAPARKCAFDTLAEITH
ncbi:MAG: hypothetical protein AAFY27_06255 [Pseudomonadota bacterium]